MSKAVDAILVHAEGANESAARAVAEALRDVQADGGDVDLMVAELDNVIDWANRLKAQLDEIPEFDCTDPILTRSGESLLDTVREARKEPLDTKTRRFGTLAGKVEVSEDFDASAAHVVRLRIEGPAHVATAALESALDAGVLQEAINDFSHEDGPVKVLSAIVSEAP
jgi:hypothetical protein